MNFVYTCETHPDERHDLICGPSQQLTGNGLNWALGPEVPEVVQKFSAAELWDRHQHNAERGKALQRARGRLAEEAISCKDALEPGFDRRFNQCSVGQTAPSSVIRSLASISNSPRREPTFFGMLTSSSHIRGV
jgi:hypothetical protein